MAARQSAETAPWSLPQSQLEKWSNKNIQYGTKIFGKKIRRAINRMVKHLHAVCSSHPELFNVNKVVRGGSLGKGTMVKDLSDVDMVVFINPPHLKPIHSYGSPQEYQRALKEVIKSLRSAISKMISVRNIESTEYLVGFEVRVADEWVPFDLLPTADNFGIKTNMTKFRRVLGMKDEFERSFYSASLVDNQRRFVRPRPGYVKELIRLVKYWAYGILPKELRKSYPLELITIYCWEEAGSPVKFSKAQGLKAVLTTLTNLETLHHYWTKQYSSELAQECIRRLDIRSPYVLDPANPTNNVCSVYQGEKKTKMKLAAESTLQCRLFRGVTDWY